MSVGWLVHPFVILSNLYQHLWLLFAFSVFLNTKLSNYGEVFDNLMVVDINKVEGNIEAQLLTERCMRQTCGFAAVPAATAAQQRDRVGNFQSRKSTAKQSEK